MANDLVTVKVMTISKKIIRQLDCIYECYNPKEGIFVFDEENLFTKSGVSLLGKIPSEIINWMNGHAFSVLVQKADNTACLIPYFSKIMEKYPDLKTLVIV